MNQLFQQGDNNNLAIKSAMSNLNQEFKEREVAIKAKELNLGYVDLKNIPINADYLQIIPQEYSLKGNIIAFYNLGKRLKVAFTYPENDEAKKIIAGLQEDGFEVNKNICSKESLDFAQQHFESKLHFEKKEIVATVEKEKIDNVAEELRKISNLNATMEGMKSDEALNLLHEEILKVGASDLHFEPKKESYRVRARVDGILLDFFELKKEVAKGLIRQIKHNAQLKFNVEDMPQDGKFSFQVTDRKVDVRVSTLPVNYGEGVVLRFLDPKKGLLTLSELGFSSESLKNFEKALQSTNGLILVTGPTGSGKTTTLHSALSQINSPKKKIITLEDPVEFELKGIVQCEIDESIGFTFSEGLHSILRQDPDVVMIGEIRDLATAETAVQASLTGHLVFSSLHTNSAADAIPRLLNVGVAPFILSPSIRCIIAQRLVRTLCKNCAQFEAPPEAIFNEIDKILTELNNRGYNFKMPEKIAIEKGCDRCSGTGFRGQTVVAEILLIDSDIQEMIQEGVTSNQILETAKKNGMRTMWEEGIIKITEGTTSFSEILRGIGR